MIMEKVFRRSGRRGFTLLELVVVVLIIGVLAAIAVPQYFAVVEKSRVAEAASMLDAVRGAQERYLARKGVYCGGAMPDPTGTCAGWDLDPTTLKYFSYGAMTGGAGWNLTLTRVAPAPAAFGQYTVQMNVVAGQPPAISCTSSPRCCEDMVGNVCGGG